MYSSSNENRNTSPIKIDTFALVSLIGNIVLKIALAIFVEVYRQKRIPYQSKLMQMIIAMMLYPILGLYYSLDHVYKS